MTEPDIAFEVLDGRRAAELATGFLAMHAEVYEEPPYRWVDNQHERFARRFAVLCRQPGFVLAEARHGEYLVGFGCGMPLRPSTDWWRDLTTPLSSEVTAEYPGRTFAVADLLVRAAWRRQKTRSACGLAGVRRICSLWISRSRILSGRRHLAGGLRKSRS